MFISRKGEGKKRAVLNVVSSPIDWLNAIIITNLSDKIIIVSRFGGDYSNIQNAINEANEGSIIFIKKC